MPDIPLELPPGIRANGTKYARRGAWVDCSRIRWNEGCIEPIGGWARFATNVGELDAIGDPLTEVFRSTLSYKINDGSGMFVAGSNRSLKAWYRGAPEVHDITPTGFSQRGYETTVSTGYGQWFYNADEYGTERQGENLDQPDTFVWAFRVWGQNLLAAPKGAPSQLYEWAPSFLSPAVPVANAPMNFDCFHVTDQRMVMLAGAANEPRLVQWCSSENNTDWNYSNMLNTAGFFTIPGTGRFKAIVNVQDKILLVSESDAYVATYLGPPYIYGFEQAGDNCGTVAPNGVVSTEDFAIWPGRNNFYIYDGSTVKPLPCPVLDRYMVNVNRTHISKTIGFVNPGFTEIWWLYQEGAEEVDSYIYYDWMANHWGLGKMARTAAYGNDAVGGLYMIGADCIAYNHEMPNVLPIVNSMDEIFVESAPIELGGPQYISHIIPDYEGQGIVAITLKGQDVPTGPYLNFGPYLLTYPAAAAQPVPVRARGQLVTVRIEGRSQGWVQGAVTLHATQGMRGRRR